LVLSPMLTPPFSKHETAEPAKFLFEKLVLPAGDVQPAPTIYHHIVMHVGSPVATRRSLDGETQQRVQLIGDFDVIPAGMAGRWRNEQEVELLLIEIDPEFVAKLGDGDIAPAPFLPIMQLRDEQLHHLALALLAENRSPVPTGRLYMESLMSALLLRLLSLRQGAALGHGESGDRLSMLKQQKLIEFIEAGIASDLSLPELANIVGYGVSRFKTLFKNSFGCTPHEYVLNRRVERARALIAAGTLSLSQIALESGFSHQSHMAAAFRKSLGVSPGQLRHAVRK
jgi:AraC family transcriptional regulator